MKKISNKLIIAIALIIITMVIFYFQNIKEYEIEVPMTPVVVAVEDIPENTIIKENMVKLEERYSEDLAKQKDSLTSTLGNIVGKRTITPIYKNEEINKNRLIENQPYMEEKDNEKRTMFTISITTSMDKALDIRKGSYIDIWLQPNQNIYSEYKEKNISYTEPKPEKLFEKLKVYKARTESFTESLAFTEGENKNSKENATTYLTLYLTDREIAKYLKVPDWNYNKRITLYGENIKYNLIKEEIGEKPQEDTTETSIEEGEMENE